MIEATGIAKIFDPIIDLVLDLIEGYMAEIEHIRDTGRNSIV